MPVERVSQGFKDISSSFKVNPLSEDLIAIKNETAIARSIRNLVLTHQGARFFNPLLGSQVSGLLFENIDGLTSTDIEDQIKVTIENFEPRVNLTEVTAIPDYDLGGFDITVDYEIVGIDILPQTLSFALQPTR